MFKTSIGLAIKTSQVQLLAVQLYVTSCPECNDSGQLVQTQMPQTATNICTECGMTLHSTVFIQHVVSWSSKHINT